MAHVEHYTKQDIKKIMREHARKASNYVNRVDLSRSDGNFCYKHAGKQPDEVREIVLARCRDIMKGKRMQDHTHVVSEWCFTYPSELCYKKKRKTGKFYTDEDGKQKEKTVTYYVPKDKDHMKRFFDRFVAFAEKKYGKQNVIAAWVHMDETTPHIHLIIVPEAESRKTGRKTVSSASLFTREALRKFHPELGEYMAKEFGEKAKEWIMNGRTKGNYTIRELQARKRDREEIKAEREDIEDSWSEIDDAETMLREMYKALLGKEFPEDGEIETYLEDIKKWFDDEIASNRESLRLLEESKKAYIMAKDLERLKEFEEKEKQLRERNSNIERISKHIGKLAKAIEEKAEREDKQYV